MCFKQQKSILNLYDGIYLYFQFKLIFNYKYYSVGRFSVFSKRKIHNIFLISIEIYIPTELINIFK